MKTTRLRIIKTRERTEVYDGNTLVGYVAESVLFVIDEKGYANEHSVVNSDVETLDAFSNLSRVNMPLFRTR